MYMEHISRSVDRLIKKYGETEPEKLCRTMGIILLEEPMGTLSDVSCKGFYLIQSNKQAIVVNNDLPEVLRRVVIAHELGHAVLHKKAAGVYTFHDFIMFDNVSKFEYEANLFAAELLIQDEAILALLDDDISFFTAASRLFVPPELLDFKFRLLKCKGYKINDPPFTAKSNFLKNLSK